MPQGLTSFGLSTMGTPRPGVITRSPMGLPLSADDLQGVWASSQFLLAHSVPSRADSYSLKHAAERWWRSRDTYLWIGNGCLIMAAISLGARFKRIDPRSQNATFDWRGSLVKSHSNGSQVRTLER